MLSTNFFFSERIEQFIDDHKALMRRMYGDFVLDTSYGPPLPNSKRKRDTTSFYNRTMPPGVPDLIGPPDLTDHPMDENEAGSGASYFEEFRTKRQTDPNTYRNTGQRTTRPNNIPLNPSMEPHTGRLVYIAMITVLSAILNWFCFLQN